VKHTKFSLTGNLEKWVLRHFVWNLLFRYVDAVDILRRAFQVVKSSLLFEGEQVMGISMG